MINRRSVFLEKALESLACADQEVANGRYNNAANRCYYACFQAAVTALIGAGLASPGSRGQWSHTTVPAQFVGILINRRKLYPSTLRNTLQRNYQLRQAADYTDDMIMEVEAARAVRRACEFVLAVQAREGNQ
jgi:uncharacterized protein (UPF0332 family)